MKHILHVTCSPRGRQAASFRLSRKVVECLIGKEAGATVIERMVDGNVLPHVDSDYATSLASAGDVAQGGSLARSDGLIEELKQCDYLVIGTPIHNFMVPSALKAWLDHVVRVRRTFDIGASGKIALLRDRPVFVAISAGGRFTGEAARQPDFVTPYLKAVLDMIGLRDLTFFSVEGTAPGPNPTATSLAEAELAVQEHFASAMQF